MSELIPAYTHHGLVSVTLVSNTEPGKEERNPHQMFTEIIWLPTSQAISLIVFTLPGAPHREGHLKSIFGLDRSDYATLAIRSIAQHAEVLLSYLQTRFQKS